MLTILEYRRRSLSNSIVLFYVKKIIKWPLLVWRGIRHPTEPPSPPQGTDSRLNAENIRLTLVNIGRARRFAQGKGVPSGTRGERYDREVHLDESLGRCMGKIVAAAGKHGIELNYLAELKKWVSVRSG